MFIIHPYHNELLTREVKQMFSHYLTVINDYFNNPNNDKFIPSHIATNALHCNTLVGQNYINIKNLNDNDVKIVYMYLRLRVLELDIINELPQFNQNYFSLNTINFNTLYDILYLFIEYNKLKTIIPDFESKSLIYSEFQFYYIEYITSEKIAPNIQQRLSDAPIDFIKHLFNFIKDIKYNSMYINLNSYININKTYLKGLQSYKDLEYIK